MAQDERERLAAVPPPPAPIQENTELLDLPDAPRDIQYVASLLRELPLKATGKDRAAFEKITASTQPLLTYLEHRDEIEAASATLEAHREEFDALADDNAAFANRSQTLFAEETFAPLRFTVDDLQRASDRLGPLDDLFSDQGIDTIRKAILFLADEERRMRIAMSLWALSPRYVAEERYLDGLIIQHCAYLTMEETTESNPFLFAMFSFGYDAWMEGKRARDAEMLKGIGLDVERMRSMSMEELENCLETLQSDPAKLAQVEAMMEAHPDQRDEAVDHLQRLERDSIKLLEGENALALLLSPEEIEPWLPAMMEFWERAFNQHPELMSADTPPDTSLYGELIKAIWPLIQKMAKTIFTPERIQQLVSQIKNYRNERFNAGDKSVAGWSFAAIASLEREDDPAQNYFITALCYVSLRQCIGEIASAPDSAEEAAPPTAEPAN